MKKIISKEQKEKKQRNSQIIIGLVLIVLMIFSVLGYALSGTNETSEKIVYNEVEFIQKNSYWYFNVNNKQFATQYNPYQVNMSSNIDLKIKDYQGEVLYIVGNANELIRNLNGIYSRYQNACLDNNCSNNYPIKNCSDNIIIIKDSEKNNIYQNDSCIFIESNETIKMQDYVLFKILEIK